MSRKTIFQARVPIPSAGSPGMAAGTLMFRSAAWQAAGEAGPGFAGAAGRAEAGAAVSKATATAAVAAQTARRGSSGLRAIMGSPPADCVG